MEEQDTYYRTVVEIYSRFDGEQVELVDLAQAATDGDAICVRQSSAPVQRGDLPGEATNFFDEEF